MEEGEYTLNSEVFLLTRYLLEVEVKVNRKIVIKGC